MYEYIKGNITFISPYYIVLEAYGIGYQIAVANPFSYSPFYHKETQVYVYQVIRDDAHLLYGFATLEEKQLFLKLISVSGIGPKSALAIMALEDHGGLVYAIETEDAAYLTKFPGVGKKTAQQMILDLQGKLDELAMTPSAAEQLSQDTAGQPAANDVLAEALEALRALGYSEREVKRITKSLEQSDAATTDGYLRQGLKLLMKK
ncbi:Holliday junction branch migration protein RuvA [Vagococcus acidifermentans]|uniref:Holliday junction branch migration complex subunit RuvA n=1 Tax=Vagococcus acidifermentans TaxID=564710 RepID=A0A430B2X1_9ENTE|nr:Holliday junction branch migration protein RuvA [Vagococcus acidifermentans]RSU14562.1 Holliday junction branch migration protein RuvA [Vagococcus acidifermentans]